MQGLIIIPDMSGFTNFVNTVNMDIGVSIIRDLLNEIINKNSLDVELSEIEGDAILYYKVGKPISLMNMIAGFKKISKAFDARYDYLKSLYNIKANLSLKFIVHYGNINLYNINGFRQLYGDTVIESHSLLKNGCGATNYILITEDYLKALAQTNSETILDHKEYDYHYSDISIGLRKIGYYYFNYSSNTIKENLLVRA